MSRKISDANLKNIKGEPFDANKLAEIKQNLIISKNELKNINAELKQIKISLKESQNNENEINLRRIRELMRQIEDNIHDEAFVENPANNQNLAQQMFLEPEDEAFVDEEDNANNQIPVEDDEELRQAQLQIRLASLNNDRVRILRQNQEQLLPPELLNDLTQKLEKFDQLIKEYKKNKPIRTVSDALSIGHSSEKFYELYPDQQNFKKKPTAQVETNNLNENKINEDEKIKSPSDALSRGYSAKRFYELNPDAENKKNSTKQTNQNLTTQSEPKNKAKIPFNQSNSKSFQEISDRNKAFYQANKNLSNAKNKALAKDLKELQNIFELGEKVVEEKLTTEEERKAKLKSFKDITKNNKLKLEEEQQAKIDKIIQKAARPVNYSELPEKSGQRKEEAKKNLEKINKIQAQQEKLKNEALAKRKKELSEVFKEGAQLLKKAAQKQEEAQKAKEARKQEVAQKLSKLKEEAKKFISTQLEQKTEKELLDQLNIELNNLGENEEETYAIKNAAAKILKAKIVESDLTQSYSNFKNSNSTNFSQPEFQKQSSSETPSSTLMPGPPKSQERSATSNIRRASRFYNPKPSSLGSTSPNNEYAR
jgi:hypothetical protein